MNGMTVFTNRPEQDSTKSTFEIEVRFLQNATWQGNIHWIEKNQKQSFRSTLEMLKLMDEALAAGAEYLGNVSWED